MACKYWGYYLTVYRTIPVFCMKKITSSYCAMQIALTIFSKLI